MYKLTVTHSVDLHSVVPHKVNVLNALKYAQLFGHPAGCSVVIRLQLNLLHRHQFTSLIVHSCVHFTESTLTCNKNTTNRMESETGSIMAHD
jgi:hypothetical protein